MSCKTEKFEMLDGMENDDEQVDFGIAIPNKNTEHILEAGPKQQTGYPFC